MCRCSPSRPGWWFRRAGASRVIGAVGANGEVDVEQRDEAVERRPRLRRGCDARQRDRRTCAEQPDSYVVGFDDRVVVLDRRVAQGRRCVQASGSRALALRLARARVCVRGGGNGGNLASHAGARRRGAMGAISGRSSRARARAGRRAEPGVSLSATVRPWQSTNQCRRPKDQRHSPGHESLACW